MRKSRFSEEQIIAILREQEGGQADEGCLPPPRHQRSEFLQVEVEVRRHGRFRC
jgi:hypothetical protein